MDVGSPTGVQQLDVATERQIAANRRNASRSTGPRSPGGKKRVGRNAYRHGLSLGIGGSPADANQIEARARKIVCDAKRDFQNFSALWHARAIAHAGLELERVRRVKLALIERVRVLGAYERHPHLKTVSQIRRFLDVYKRGIFI
jgi:hypothetical protein